MKQMSIPGTPAAPPPQRDAQGRFASSKGADVPSTGRAVVRADQGQGVYSPFFSGYVPRVQDPLFYEILREAIPILDTALRRYSDLDGFVEIECAGDAAQRAADEWAEGVVVNDIQLGLQAAFAQWTGEIYEQGAGVMEFVANDKRNDVARLITADSKRIWFRRESDGSLSAWYQPDLRTPRDLGAPQGQSRAILQPAWTRSTYTGFAPARAVRLSMESVIVGHHDPQNQDPHGASVLRSVPFVAKILTTINNAVMHMWERFGDPSFVVVYKSGGKRMSGEDAKRITTELASNLSSVISAKRAGRSADIVRTIGKDDDIKLEVLGANNEVLDVGMAGDFVISQVVSGSGLCRTLLNLPVQAEEKAAISSALFSARKRFAAYRPLLSRPVAAMFALRGVRVRPGDWRLVQRQPDYEDILKQAQARFMDAQRLSVYGVRFKDDPVEISTGKRSSASGPPPSLAPSTRLSLAKGKADPSPLIEKTVRSVERDWMALASKVIGVLGLPAVKTEYGPLSAEDIGRLKELVEGWPDYLETRGGYLDASIEGVADLGFSAAAASAGLEGPLLQGALRSQVRAEAARLMFDQVKNQTHKILHDQILDALDKGILEGEGPQEVARWLWSRFDGSRSNWARTVRTELGDAFTSAKHAEWEAQGQAALTSVISDPSCAICGPKAGTYPLSTAPRFPRDTHPNCTCDSRPATQAELERAGLADLDINPSPARGLTPEEPTP